MIRTFDVRSWAALPFIVPCRHGQNPKGRDRFRCCVFLLTYTYEARKPGVKEKITEMAFNGAGVRDTTRTLKIGINTVIRTLKTLATTSNHISGCSC